MSTSSSSQPTDSTTTTTTSTTSTTPTTTADATAPSSSSSSSSTSGSHKVAQSAPALSLAPDAGSVAGLDGLGLPAEEARRIQAQMANVGGKKQEGKFIVRRSRALGTSTSTSLILIATSAPRVCVCVSERRSTGRVRLPRSQRPISCRVPRSSSRTAPTATTRSMASAPRSSSVRASERVSGRYLHRERESSVTIDTDHNDIIVIIAIIVLIAEGCKNSTFSFNARIITEMLEIWNCHTTLVTVRRPRSLALSILTHSLTHSCLCL